MKINQKYEALMSTVLSDKTEFIVTGIGSHIIPNKVVVTVDAFDGIKWKSIKRVGEVSKDSYNNMVTNIQLGNTMYTVTVQEGWVVNSVNIGRTNIEVRSNQQLSAKNKAKYKELRQLVGECDCYLKTRTDTRNWTQDIDKQINKMRKLFIELRNASEKIGMSLIEIDNYEVQLKRRCGIR